MSQLQALEQDTAQGDDFDLRSEEHLALLDDRYNVELLDACYKKLNDGDVKVAMKDLLDGLEHGWQTRATTNGKTM